MSDLWTVAFVVIVALFLLVPFRRLKGGERGPGTKGGAEKALVGAFWVLAAVVLAVVISSR